MFDLRLSLLVCLRLLLSWRLGIVAFRCCLLNCLVRSVARRCRLWLLSALRRCYCFRRVSSSS